MLKQQLPYRTYWHAPPTRERQWWEIAALGGAAFYHLPPPPKNNAHLSISPPIGVYGLQATDLMAVLIQENRKQQTISLYYPTVDEITQKTLFTHSLTPHHPQHLIIYRLTDAHQAYKASHATMSYRLEWK